MNRTAQTIAPSAAAETIVDGRPLLERLAVIPPTHGLPLCGRLAEIGERLVEKGLAEMFESRIGAGQVFRITATGRMVLKRRHATDYLRIA